MGVLIKDEKSHEFEFVSIEYINSEKYQIEPELLTLENRMVVVN